MPEDEIRQMPEMFDYFVRVRHDSGLIECEQKIRAATPEDAIKELGIIAKDRFKLSYEVFLLRHPLVFSAYEKSELVIERLK